MRHRNAEFIKAWAEDSESVKYRNTNQVPVGQWLGIHSASIFEIGSGFEFRFTPKPVYRYIQIGASNTLDRRVSGHNVIATFTDNNLTAVEILTEGDGK